MVEIEMEDDKFILVNVHIPNEEKKFGEGGDRRGF